MLSLLYVSHIKVPACDWQTTLADIQSVSIARASRLDITGLLIASPDHFAQLLEGPCENVDPVMMSILADRRHGDIQILRRKMADFRRCRAWRMVRFESGAFTTSYVEPVLREVLRNQDDDAVRKVEQLIDRVLTDQPLAVCPIVH